MVSFLGMFCEGKETSSSASRSPDVVSNLYLLPKLSENDPDVFLLSV